MQAWSAARVSIGVPVQREQREHSAGAVRTLAFGLDSPAQSPQRLAECPPVVAHHSLSSQLRPQTSSSDQRVVTGLRAPHPKEVSLSLGLDTSQAALLAAAVLHALLPPARRRRRRRRRSRSHARTRCTFYDRNPHRQPRLLSPPYAVGHHR